MDTTWILKNLKESNGFVPLRIRLETWYIAGSTYGSVIAHEGRLITPDMYLKEKESK